MQGQQDRIREVVNTLIFLRYLPYDAEKSYERPDGEIRLEDFLYADIYEEGMVERVAKCAEDTQNYYNEQDKEK